MHTLTAPAPISILRNASTARCDDSGATLALRHLWLAGLFAVFAFAAGALLRFELLTPRLDGMEARTFGALLSMHGTLMMYFIVLPLFPAVLGYAVLPNLLGIPRLAFPRLAQGAFALLAAGGFCVLLGFLCGGTESGWMFDTALDGRFDAPGTAPAALGVLLGALALIAMFVNILATVFASPRAGDPPPFTIALTWASLTGLLACAVLACLMALALASSWFGFSVFDGTYGGDPELFSQLFRFFHSPAQNLLVLASLGAVTGLLATRSAARPQDGRQYRFLFAAMAIAGALAWEGPDARPTAGAFPAFYHTILFGGLCVAAAATIGKCVGLARRGLMRIDAPVIYALGFLLTLAAVLGSGFLLVLPATRIALGRTLFATAHLHTLMMAVLGMAFLGALHDAWPRLTGRTYSEGAARAAALVVVAGTHLAFLPMFQCGRAGMPFRANAYPPEFQVLHTLSAAGATVLLVGLLVACANLLFARRAHSSAGVLAV